jgi:hypothetical protein
MVSLKPETLARRLAGVEIKGTALADDYRALATALKFQCRTDADDVRLAKRRRREASGSAFDVAQSELAQLRRAARARQLIYGFLRGRQWVDMERNHPEGDRAIARRLAEEWLAVRAVFAARFPHRSGLAAPEPMRHLAVPMVPLAFEASAG